MSSSEEDRVDEFDIDKLRRKPTEMDLSIGNLKFKSLSISDTFFVRKLLKEKLDSKEFTIKFLFNQLIEPKHDFSIFNKISDDEIKNTALKYLKDEYNLSEFYTDKGNFFDDFKTCLDHFVKANFKSLISSISNINRFNTIFPIIPRPIFQITPIPNFNSLINQGNANINKLMFGRSYYNSFVNVSKQYNNLSTLINRIQPQINIWKNWADTNRNLFQEFINQRQNFLSSYSFDIDLVNQCLNRYQYCVTPALPLNMIFESYELCRNGGNQRNTINQHFYNYFSSDDFSNLDQMVSYWKSTNVLKHTRCKIIKGCVNLLKKDDNSFNAPLLIVPTLVAQIEGIEHELMKKRELYPQGGRWFDSDQNNVTRVQFYENEDMDLILNSAKSILLEVFYKSVYPGGSLNSPINFNRHKIAHGELLNYGTKYNVIRSFLILDFLIRLYAADES